MKKVPNTLRALFESREQHVVVYTVKGATYTGKLDFSDDKMNVVLKNVEIADSPQWLKRVFIRGSQIEYIELPDLVEALIGVESSKHK